MTPRFIKVRNTLQSQSLSKRKRPTADRRIKDLLFENSCLRAERDGMLARADLAASADSLASANKVLRQDKTKLQRQVRELIAALDKERLTRRQMVKDEFEMMTT